VAPQGVSRITVYRAVRPSCERSQAPVCQLSDLALPAQPSRRAEAGRDHAARRQARAHAVHHTLLGWFQIPPAINQPLELALNPAGDAWRSQRRVWNAGDGRTKLVCLAAPSDAGGPPCAPGHSGQRARPAWPPSMCLHAERGLEAQSSPARRGDARTSSERPCLWCILGTILVDMSAWLHCACCVSDQDAHVAILVFGKKLYIVADHVCAA